MRRTPFTAGWQTRPKASPFAELTGGAPPWEPVTLPHDATLGRERGPEHGAASGFTPGGTYEYRTTLAAPAEWRDRTVLLDLEGVYRSAQVYVNGALAGQQAAGYTGFTVALDDHLRPGEDNEIRVECRSHADSRWYAGAGIHRPVHLVVGPLLHIALDGVRVTTPDVDRDLALVEVATTVEHEGRGLRTVTVVTELRDAAGTVVGSDRVPVTVRPGEPAVVRQRIPVREPALWGPGSPTLHTAAVTLADGDEVLDEDTVSFGIRTVTVDPHRGLRINGEPVLLRGACVHSDNGVLGAAAIDRADERRVELLQAAGFNALRSAHNPMSRAVLEACDRLGVLVMDELSDVWTEGKTDFDSALTFPDWWERDLAALVRKDVNHPSVVMYSIGNEIPEVGRPSGALWSRRLAERVRQLDPTRLVTNGVNGTLSTPFDPATMALPSPDEVGINTMLATMGEMMTSIAASETVGNATAETFGVLDVAGMNYMDSRYAADRERYPNRVIVGSETFPAQIDRLWRQVQDLPHVIGDFTWTGWDYLGEAGIGRVSDAEDPAAAQLAAPWPWLAAWCGDIDLTGQRRPASYYREIVFGLRRDPYLAVERPERHGREQVLTPWSWTDTVGSWSWTGAEGRPVTVEVYSDADEVELLQDGRSLGTAPAGEEHRYRATFEVTFTPGELTAVARTGGEETGRSTLRSTTGPVQLTVVADRTAIRADDTDLAHVDLALTDAAGTVVLGADRQVTVAVDGPAVLQGLGSAAPATEESYLDEVHTTFDGHALAVVRPTGAGPITVTATAPGCAPVTVRLEAR
ncbi:Glycoside hydrolase family 2 sugar binding [Modestobacter italicus]|uniref:Glycoside hydrolase family 2 sugar binding n=1 Tax=Modestobacter italicus (strain DSM 44449 / CECT 9708 / BC 501) TaxID=2732864 RepID=I4EYD7_MODI5|nr:glycoside hydrolase family 2 TIM barrel-domain containing protein [Modestobacter marinus]CCH88400.1 Glycoside hydrolase family 2 sugar binding [Modestobacter marinus]